MSLNGSKRYFSWKKAYAIIFEKFQVISSNFDKLLHFTPDFPTNQIMDWDLDKGEILKTYKNVFEWLKTIFFLKKAYAIIFEKFQVISSNFDKLLYFTPDFPTNQIMDWDLDKGEILKLTKMNLTGLKRIFSWKKAYAIILQSFKWFKAILTSYHISHQTSPQTKSWIGT